MCVCGLLSRGSWNLICNTLEFRVLGTSGWVSEKVLLFLRWMGCIEDGLRSHDLSF